MAWSQHLVPLASKSVCHRCHCQCAGVRLRAPCLDQWYHSWSRWDRAFNCYLQSLQKQLHWVQCYSWSCFKCSSCCCSLFKKQFFLQNVGTDLCCGSKLPLFCSPERLDGFDSVAKVCSLGPKPAGVPGVNLKMLDYVFFLNIIPQYPVGIHRLKTYKTNHTFFWDMLRLSPRAQAKQEQLPQCHWAKKLHKL